MLASSSSLENAYATDPITLDAWHYLAATYDGNTLDLYVDGVLAVTAGLPSATRRAPRRLDIGAASWFSGGFTKGLIDEFSFYDVAMNAGEVQALYNAQGEPAITETGLPADDQRGLSRLFSGAIDIGSFQSQPYVVMNTSDSGPGSLREAIADDSDGTPITFAASLAGQTITLKSELLITNSVTIDGSAAPGLIVSGGGSPA